MGEAAGKRFVAHGVGWSVGSASIDPDRDAIWLEGIAATHERFHFAWYTDHLGLTVLGDEELLLPLPLPMDCLRRWSHLEQEPVRVKACGARQRRQ